MSHKKLIVFLILINYFQIKVFAYIDFNGVPHNVDTNQIYEQNVTAKRGYKVTWLNFTDLKSINNDNNTNASVSDTTYGGQLLSEKSANISGLHLVVAMPPQLRYRQQQRLPTRVRIEMVNNSAYIIIKEPNGIHRGFYSAYKVYDNTTHQLVTERRDFFINIHGLNESNQHCNEDADCFSNFCLNNQCLCSDDKPVLDDHKCIAAQPIVSKCLHSSQCQFIAGPNAECSYKRKCRCANNGRTIHIPKYGLYCITPKGYNDSCIFSEECLMIGSNRYCNEMFRCQCRHNYYHQTGTGCVRALAVVSSGPTTMSTIINVWCFLVIIFLATFATNFNL
ncbi:uncharacterized protein LOC128955356 [Oppia nitens]|uniref:uncharacterized protein LOC128955356 n=1 Tax=Oppia nitens TaxID=1686743 RepID=UPI0023DBAC2C|nr:uncharacterized protein LOC128955356 [Oppia nitens]